MRAIGLLIVFLSLAASAQAVCPPAPVGKPSDSVVQFVTSGTAGFGPTTAMDATREGAVVYDPAAKVLKVCNGTAWVEVAGGGTSSMVANWPDAIRCSSGVVQTTLYLSNSPDSDGNMYYAEPWTTGINYYLAFNPAGNFVAQTTRDYTNCKTSITAIRADGRAFNFIGGGSMPSGAIMAFDLASCPAGWTEYTPARGRFLRGIDNGAGNDPSGTRAVGNVQADAMQQITGQFRARGNTTLDDTRSGAFSGSSSGASVNWLGASPSLSQFLIDFNSANSPGARTANETRPKNVAVLYCRKS